MSVALGAVLVLNFLWALSAENASPTRILTDPGQFADRTQPMFFGYALIAVLAYLVVERISSDQKNGWLEPLFAAGLARGRYIVAVLLAALASVGVLYVTGCAAYLVSRSVVGALPAWDTFFKSFARVVPMMPSYGVFASLLAVLFSNRLATLAMIVLSTVGPWSVWLATGGTPGDGSTGSKLLFLHLPPGPDSSVMDSLLKQTVYTGITFSALLLIAELRISRRS